MILFGFSLLLFSFEVDFNSACCLSAGGCFVGLPAACLGLGGAQYTKSTKQYVLQAVFCDLPEGFAWPKHYHLIRKFQEIATQKFRLRQLPRFFPVAIWICFYTIATAEAAATAAATSAAPAATAPQLHP